MDLSKNVRPRSSEPNLRSLRQVPRRSVCPGQSPCTWPPYGIKEPLGLGRCCQHGVWTGQPLCLDLHLLPPLDHTAPPMSLSALWLLTGFSLPTVPVEGCCCLGAGVSWTGHSTPDLVGKNCYSTGCPWVSLAQELREAGPLRLRTKTGSGFGTAQYLAVPLVWKLGVWGKSSMDIF